MAKMKYQEEYVKYIGNRDPEKANYWFIGIEEGGDPSDTDIQAKWINSLNTGNISDQINNSIYQNDFSGRMLPNLKKLVEILLMPNSREKLSLFSFDQANNEETGFQIEDSRVFITNLFLLKMPNIRNSYENDVLIKNYCKYFDFNFDNVRKYREATIELIKERKKRFEEIDISKKIIFILTKNFEYEIMELLSIDDQIVFEQNFGRSKITYRSNYNVVTIPYFTGRHISIDTLNEVVSKIKERKPAKT